MSNDTTPVEQNAEQNTEQVQPETSEQVQVKSQAEPTKPQDVTEETAPANDDLIRKLRDESAARRVENRKLMEELEKEKAFRIKFEQLFGGEGEETPEQQLEKAEADLAEAYKQRDAAVAEHRALLTEQVLNQAVTAVGGDMSLTPQFVKTLPAFADLDVDSETYATEVQALVQDTIDKYTKLAAGPVVPKRSGSSEPSNGGAPKLTQQDLAELKAKGEWETINQAVRDGRIDF